MRHTGHPPYRSSRCCLASFLFSFAICFHLKSAPVHYCFMFLCSRCLPTAGSCFSILDVRLQLLSIYLGLSFSLVPSLDYQVDPIPYLTLSFFSFPPFLYFLFFPRNSSWPGRLLQKKSFVGPSAPASFVSSLIGEDRRFLRVQFGIPSKLELELSGLHGCICAPPLGHLGLYEEAIRIGLRLPISPFVLELFQFLNRPFR